MSRIPDESLLQLENEVLRALVTRDESHLHVIGYGEISTVLMVQTPEGNFACKRLPVFPRREDAQEIVDAINSYITALEAAGITCVDSDSRIVDSPNGTYTVYSVQPRLPADRLGPAYFRTLSIEEAMEATRTVWDRIAQATSPILAPDGQLANWAFLDDDVVYLDVSTPFMRDDQGKELLNWRHYANTVPFYIRWYFMREVPKVMDKYHSLRGQLLDYIGNLIKEDLELLVAPLIEEANTHYISGTPITRADVQAYYKEDASGYELLQKVKRWDRTFYRTILRKPYPYILPPKIDRNT
ncbi:MAG: hypothetical protein COA73_13065 [Candidatus Hydrogenedentota bacterium]|nr:MAG: hypothetical protein COA73_13065 [Candidatus Hydrogenedentota bacterium]